MGNLIPGCLSCDIVSANRIEPGGVVYEDDHWHVGSAMGPTIWPGFLVIKLKRHCEHMAELTPGEAAALGPVVRDTCLAVREVIHCAKVYVCSFGDGVKHIHFWVLPRPPEMRPGMHSVILNLDLRVTLTRLLGLKRWVRSDNETAETAERLREQFRRMREGGASQPPVGAGQAVEDPFGGRVTLVTHQYTPGGSVPHPLIAHHLSLSLTSSEARDLP